LFCRYSDLTSRQLIEYKTILKKENVNFKFIKNTLNLYKTDKFGNQGPTLIIYLNNFSRLKSLEKFFNKNKKLQLIYAIHQKKVYTNFKIAKLLNNDVFTDQLISTLCNLYITLLRIN
jgi:ribosomal protein L10